MPRVRQRTSATRTDFLGLEPLEERWLLAVFQSGDIFLARSDGQIEHLSGNGSFIKQFDSHSSLGTDEQPRGMALDDGHNLFVTNPFAASVSRFDSGGNFVASFGDGYSGEPQSIVFDQDGNAFIGAITAAPGDPAVNLGKPFDNRIREFNPTGGLIGQFQVAVETGGVGWIDLAADQHTLYYTSGGHRILRYDTRTETQLSDFNTAALSGSQAQGLKILPSGGVLVADTQTIERLDANGAVMQSYDADEVDSWFDVHIDPDGTSFWAADRESGDLYKFDLASGDELLHLETGEFDDLFGLAIVDEPTAARNRVSVSNVERFEGNSGTTAFVFAISLEHATDAPLTLRYSTVDRTAQLQDNDYQQLSGELTFLPGELTKQVTVSVVGDLKSENDEQFQLLVEDPFGSGADPTIAATANLYRAGSAGAQGGTAPLAIPIDPSGSGTLSFPSLRVQTPPKAGDAWPEIDTADGATQQFETPRGTNISAFGGLSGIRVDRFMFLAGVFVSETTPSENNAPESLDFRPVGTTPASLGTQFEQLAPKLNQVFYIGDGWTDAGALQRFVAPQGATRLLLGFVDGEFFGSEEASPPGFYDDNTGAIRATLEQDGGIGTVVDDPDPLPNASIDSISHREPDSGVAPFVFQVTLDAPSARVITVPYHTEDGTASSASGDFVAKTGTLTFLPGTPLSQPVTVLVNADSKLELDETFKVVLGPATNATTDESPGIGTIDENGLLSLNLADEDDSGVSNTDNLTKVASPHFLVRAARAGLLSIDVEGPNSMQPQPVEVLAGSLTTFQPQVPLRDGVYTIRAVLDSEEFDPVVQTLTFTIDTRGPKLLGLDGASAALQFDGVDDLVAIPNLAPISSREWIFSEPIDPAIADLADQFSLTGPRTRVIRSISGAGAIYTLEFDRTFTPGDYTIAGPLAIEDLAGNLIDQNQDGIGGEPGEDEAVDNFELLPAIPHGISISNVSQAEGDSGLTSFVFTFTLDAASDRPIDVAYETRDGTATVADQDYVAQQGTVTFAPGTTVQKVTVLVRGDTGIEPNETFSLVMTDDQEGTLTQEPGGGTGTIVNDDGFFPAPIPPLFPGQPPLTSQHQPPPPPEPELPLGTGIATPLVIPIQPGLILNFSPPLAPRSEQQVDDITSPLDLRGTRQATNMLEKEFALMSFLADDDHVRLLGVEPGDETPEAPPQVARPTLARTEVETKKPIDEAAFEEASSFRLWWLAVTPFVLGGGKLAWDRWQRSQPRALTRARGGASRNA